MGVVIAFSSVNHGSGEHGQGFAWRYFTIHRMIVKNEQRDWTKLHSPSLLI